MGDASAGETSLWEWAYGILLTVLGGSIVFLFKRQDDQRTEIMGVLTKMADSNAAALKEVAAASADAIRGAVTQGEEGRRRIWDHLHNTESDGHQARLEDSRRYVTKDDLDRQTGDIKRMIDSRPPVTGS